MTTIRGVLMDLDGVLYVGRRLLPGAVEAMARLRAAAIPVCCITNTTRRSRQRIRADLADMGLTVADDQLLTPARAARDYLAAERLAPYLLIHPGLAEDFAGIAADGTQAVVIGDAGEGFTYAVLNHAFRLLMTGAPLLALATNRYFRDADGLSLDAGPFVAALEHAAGVQARLFGKPSPAFFQAAVASIGCAPADAIMIGDDAESDVNGALAAGVPAILVRTGKYRAEDEARLDARATVADNVRAAVDRILE